MDEIRGAVRIAPTSGERDGRPRSPRRRGLRGTATTYRLQARPSGWMRALTLMGLAAGGVTLLAG
ncbi:MAG TPA: hypothetical protein VK878_08135 [Candidatus Deferrimicrobiaceae bacterium]|nr:hypothetical protein [Candidatus Deferrimicrobiaceae bacterium]